MKFSCCKFYVHMHVTPVFLFMEFRSHAGGMEMIHYWTHCYSYMLEIHVVSDIQMAIQRRLCPLTYNFVFVLKLRYIYIYIHIIILHSSSRDKHIYTYFKILHQLNLTRRIFGTCFIDVNFINNLYIYAFDFFFSSWNSPTPT